MNYKEDLMGIDYKIEVRYQELVLRGYYPVFSEVVKESAKALSDKNVGIVGLGLPVKRLSFLQNGSFLLDGEHIFPKETLEGCLAGLFSIARVYQESGYRQQLQTTLKMCLSDLVSSVKDAVRLGA